MKNAIYSLLAVLTAAASNSHANTPPPQSQHPAIMAGYGNIPLSFEANQGQADKSVQFLAHGPGYTLLLSPTGATMGLTKSIPDTTKPDNQGKPTEQAHTSSMLHMNLVAANANAPVAAVDELPGKVNYLQGNNPAHWHTNIATYGKVKYQQVYKGIDMVYYGNQRQLEYDFIVAPGADPQQIRLSFTGLSAKDSVHPQLNSSGELQVGDMQLKKPLIYQEEAGQRKPIEGQFVVHADHQVGFKLAAYNAKLPLVIDPIMVYSTYLGGIGTDEIRAIAVDADGQAYVTGVTASTNFPVAGGVSTPFGGGYDAFVSKLNAAGSALVYSTFLGGSSTDAGYSIAVAADGQAYVTGVTTSANFPTVAGGVSTTLGGQNAFVSKLNAAGTALVYSTFLGGNNVDRGYGIAVDADGQAYVTGYTLSTNFPVAGGVSTTKGGGYDAFVSKLNATGSALVYSRFLGGNNNDSGFGIAVAADGQAYVTGFTQSTNFPTVAGGVSTTQGGGNDAFVSKLTAASGALVYSTFLGGSADDFGNGIAVAADGQAYVTGQTNSNDFPKVAGGVSTPFGGGIDAFVSKLNAASGALVYSTFLGGSADDFGNGIAVAADGQAYVTGQTNSNDFPVAGGVSTTLGGSYDAFVSKLTAASGALVYSRFLGGSANDTGYGIAVTTSGIAYVAGRTASASFPVTTGGFQTANSGEEDGFVAAFAPTYTLATTTTGTGNGVISSNPSGITCGLDCTEDYLVKTEVTLTATPANANSIFMGWAGDCAGSGECKVTMDANKTAQATFATVYTVSVVKNGIGGSVSSSPSGINCGSTCSAPFVQGTSVNLTAIPAAGYSFAGWSGDCSGLGACSFNVNAAKNVNAQFVQGNLLAVTKQGDSSGTVTSSPTGINCGSDCVEAYTTKNKLVYLTAKPAADSVFSGWSGANGIWWPCNKAPACLVKMDTAKNITATFTKKPIPSYVLKVAKLGTAGTVSSTPAGINCGSDCTEAYPKNTIITLTATPAAGSAFKAWVGACRGHSATCKVTMSAAKSVMAIFK